MNARCNPKKKSGEQCGAVTRKDGLCYQVAGTFESRKALAHASMSGAIGFNLTPVHVCRGLPQRRRSVANGTNLKLKSTPSIRMYRIGQSE